MPANTYAVCPDWISGGAIDRICMSIPRLILACGSTRLCVLATLELYAREAYLMYSTMPISDITDYCTIVAFSALG